jgi:GGDEF domain-containing protein
MADGDDVEDLVLERELLLAEVEALRGEVEYLLALAGKEPLADHIARRRFLTRLEDEVARAARIDAARFTVVAIDVDGGAPRSLVPHVRKVVRKGDLLVRASRSMFLVLLHEAGPLGRRRFEDRLFQALSLHEQQTSTSLSVRVRSALYPRDGTTAVELIKATQQSNAFSTTAPPTDPKKAEGARRLKKPATAGTATPSSAERAIRECLATDVEGEVVVRGNDGIGRIYVARGNVAWAHCSSSASPGARSLTEAIVRAQGASLKDVRDAFARCRASGENIAEHLIDAGVVSRDTMRAILGRHIQAHLIGVLTLEDPEVLFLPQSRSYGSDLLFNASELFGE